MSHPALSFLRANGHARVTLDECYLLTRQLHILQKSGVPLLSSLQALQVQLPSKALRHILGQVQRDLLDGRTLTQALARHPQAFRPEFLALTRVGEAGGILENVLEQLTKLFEWEIDLRNRLREALQYPLIVVATLFVAVTVMLVFVLPQFAQMFQSFKIELPLQTRLLIVVGTLCSRHGWLLALLGLATLAGLWMALQTPAGRLRWHRLKIRLPVVGPIFLQLAMSRFARVTAVLYRSGVTPLETLDLASESVNNAYIEARLQRVRERIQQGGSLAKAMGAEAVFPAIVVQMVATGEETGRLDELLQSVSEYYDQQVSYSVKGLITFVEPALLLMVGLGVLIMASAVLVPMWDLVKVFKQGR